MSTSFGDIVPDKPWIYLPNDTCNCKSRSDTSRNVYARMVFTLMTAKHLICVSTGVNYKFLHKEKLPRKAAEFLIGRIGNLKTYFFQETENMLFPGNSKPENSNRQKKWHENQMSFLSEGIDNWKHTFSTMKLKNLKTYFFRENFSIRQPVYPEANREFVGYLCKDSNRMIRGCNKFFQHFKENIFSLTNF